MKGRASKSIAGKGWEESALRSILITVMLVIAVISIYNAVTGGAGGTKQQVRDSGVRISQTIQSIDP